MIRKVRSHLTQNEGLIFEQSAPASAAWNFRRSTSLPLIPPKL